MSRPSARLRGERLESRLTPSEITLLVTTVEDVVDPSDGVFSLREAITEAQVDPLESTTDYAPRVIRFAPELDKATIPISRIGGTQFGPAAFEIRRYVRIEGNGQKITRADSAPHFRLFNIIDSPDNYSPDLQLSNVELLNGYSDGAGGAIYIRGSGVVLSNSVIANNSALGHGGAIFSHGGRVNFNNSTVTGNVVRPTADGTSAGGAVFARYADRYGAAISITSSTLFGNVASLGSQVYVGPQVECDITGSILFGDPAVSTDLLDLSDRWYTRNQKNIIGSVVGQRGEIVASTHPMLGPLQDNGGPTRTMLPQPGSPAIDTGDGYLGGAGGPDQRGFLRRVGLKIDIGAVEFGATPTGGGPAPANIALGAAAGSRPEVRLLRADGSEVARFLAYDEQFLGGVRVAMDEVTGDDVPDIITAAGPGGGPHVKVFDGFTLREIRSFFAFDPDFRGGVTLSALYQKILVGAGPGGGPHVKLYDATTVTELKSFFAFDEGFRGGVTVALAGNGPVFAGLIVGAGPGGGPHVRLFHPEFLSIHYDFMAYDPGFRGGVSVASLSTHIVTGTMSGAPHVKAFRDLRSWWGIDLGQVTWPVTSLPEVASFFAGDPTGTTGVTIGTAGTFNWPKPIPLNSYYPRTYGEHALFTSVDGELTRYSIQPDDGAWDPTVPTGRTRRSKLEPRPLSDPVSGVFGAIGGLPSMVEV